MPADNIIQLNRHKPGKSSSDKPKWQFSSRLRRHAFGWKSSKLACQRVKQAISEIKKAKRKNPVLSAEGAILFIEKIVPAIEQVDSSSGALGTAVRNALETLIAIIADAPVDAKARRKWRDRIWEAFNDDGMGYLDEISDYWADLCETKEIASEYADEFLPFLKESWRPETNLRYYNGTGACLSCMLKAERYQELYELMGRAPFVYWNFRKYGVMALAKMELELSLLGTI